MDTVFISYRRADSADICGRISEKLAGYFGKDHVFKDVDSLLPGALFRDTIAQIIPQSTAEIVIIGPDWLTVTDEHGRRRLDDSNDLVLLEVEMGLRNRLPMLVLLVNGLEALPIADLPGSLQGLADAQTFVIRNNADFSSDVQMVINAIVSLGLVQARKHRQRRQRRVRVSVNIATAIFIGIAILTGLGIYIISTVTNKLAEPYLPPTNDRRLYAVAPLSNGDAWAVGNDIEYEHNGSWQALALPKNLYDMHGITMLSKDEGWAVGYSGAIIHYHNRQWQSVKSVNNADLNSITSLPDGEVWAVGKASEGQGTILHLTASGTWQAVSSPVGADLMQIDMVSATDGWITGTNATLLHYDGNSWLDVPNPKAISMLSMISATDGWGTDGGNMYHYINGLWYPVPITNAVTNSNYAGIDSLVALPNGECWALSSKGYHSTIYHEKDNSWQEATSKDGIEAMAIVSPIEGWAVGDKDLHISLHNGVWSTTP